MMTQFLILSPLINTMNNTKYKQIKEYVDDHMRYYAFYPFDIVLNTDTDKEETLSYEEYWHVLKNKSTYDVPV